jgi:hypothetical protein
VKFFHNGKSTICSDRTAPGSEVEMLRYPHKRYRKNITLTECETVLSGPFRETCCLSHRGSRLLVSEKPRKIFTGTHGFTSYEIAIFVASILPIERKRVCPSPFQPYRRWIAQGINNKIGWMDSNLKSIRMKGSIFLFRR